MTACDAPKPGEPAASVTMKLPPPRPADARPGFTELIDEVPEAADTSAS